MFREQLNEYRARSLNHIHREMKIYFSEYRDAFGKIDGAFSLKLLKRTSSPNDLITLGAYDIRHILPLR